MSQQSIIQIRNLSKSYKDIDVLKNINLEVEKGGVFALLGSNGAGKTTTIKILTTLVKPDAGSVNLAGHDVLNDSKGVRKHIALTGQFAAVDEMLTGRENLWMIGRLLNINPLEERIAELLEAFELADAADRSVSTYSGGMKRKIDIAMSLIGNPDVIFLDEPTTGLDPQSRKAMWHMIERLAKTGVTIFLTTQYLEEAEALADVIAILDKGHIVAQGSYEALREIISDNVIKLRFGSHEDMNRAKLLISDVSTIIFQEGSELTIESHSAVDTMTKVLSRLQANRITLTDFEKRKASLEEIYMEIINTETKKGDEHAISS